MYPHKVEENLNYDIPPFRTGSIKVGMYLKSPSPRPSPFRGSRDNLCKQNRWLMNKSRYCRVP